MRITRILDAIRASKNISYAVNEGRAPRRQDLAVLGLEDVFDVHNRSRKSID